MIVGIAGRKGSGKDAAAAAAIRRLGGRRYAFADELKRQCIAIFALDPKDALDPALKETPFPPESWDTQPKVYVMDHFLDRMRRVSGLNIQPAGKVATTYRELYQFYGTEYVRAVEDMYWIRRLFEEIGAQRALDSRWWTPWNWRKARYAYITDTRFENEVGAIAAAGGVVIRIERPGLEANGYSNHASETAIDTLPVNALVINSGSLEFLAWRFCSTVEILENTA